MTAENLRKEFGVFDQKTDSSITVSGRDLISGVPSQDGDTDQSCAGSDERTGGGMCSCNPVNA